MLIVTSILLAYAFAVADSGIACPMLDCISECKYGHQLDEKGCASCECIDPCKGIVCKSGEFCEVSQENDCEGKNCSNSPTCVERKCYPVRCSRKCESGFQVDLYGCQNCLCVNPCEYHECPTGQVCEPLDVNCLVAPCYQTPNCREECPLIKCSINCQSGYRVDFKGCRKCECIDPCEHHKCAQGEVCKQSDVLCLVAPCYQIAKCQKECPLRKCSPCIDGYVYDKYGCRTCKCLPPKDNPCKDVVCEDYQECQEIVAPCLIHPCPVFGECFNKTL